MYTLKKHKFSLLCDVRATSELLYFSAKIFQIFYDFLQHQYFSFHLRQKCCTTFRHLLVTLALSKLHSHCLTFLIHSNFHAYIPQDYIRLPADGLTHIRPRNITEQCTMNDSQGGGQKWVKPLCKERRSKQRWVEKCTVFGKPANISKMESLHLHSNFHQLCGNQFFCWSNMFQYFENSRICSWACQDFF